MINVITAELCRNFLDKLTKPVSWSSVLWMYNALV